MKKQNLFFDLDGMKFDTLPVFVSYINNRYGIQTKTSDHIGNNDRLDAVIKKHAPHITLSWEEIYKDVGENFHSSIVWHKDVEPMEDMCEVISLLSNKYNLYTVTARQKVGVHVVQYLLDTHIPGCIDDIHCVWDYIEGKGFFEISKKDFIKNTQGDNIGFFDDSLNEVMKVKNTIPSYLFDPMDLYADVQGVTRIRSWQQIGHLYL
ncbi:MAG: hypothetical protein WCQ32_00795 [bacterium]